MRLVSVLLMSVLLGACSLFGDDDDLGPAPLVKFEPSLQVSKVWSADLGGSPSVPLAGVSPSHAANTLYAASHSGQVAAYDLGTGKLQWKTRLEGERLTGGPGVGAGLLVVGTDEGRVIALDAATGSELWRAQTSSEVIAKPAVTDEMVVVRSQDGRVYGFDRATGERRWFHNRTVPLLSLRGNSAPLTYAGLVFIGSDDGRVTALRVRDGAPVWEQAVAVPQGRTELERMVDIDGQIVNIGTDLYAASYQGAIASLTADSGRVLWTKDISSYAGLSASRNHLAVADADDAVLLLERQSGGSLWRQDALARRGLATPVFHAGALVVGDSEGYLHWLSLDEGRFIARRKVGDAAINGQPLVVGDLLIAQDREGRIVAFRG